MGHHPCWASASFRARGQCGAPFVKSYGGFEGWKELGNRSTHVHSPQVLPGSLLETQHLSPGSQHQPPHFAPGPALPSNNSDSSIWLMLLLLPAVAPGALCISSPGYPRGKGSPDAPYDAVTGVCTHWLSHRGEWMNTPDLLGTLQNGQH